MAVLGRRYAYAKCSEDSMAENRLDKTLGSKAMSVTTLASVWATELPLKVSVY